MAHSKITRAFLCAALILAGGSLQAQNFHWHRTLMDGSRTSVPANLSKATVADVKAIVDAVQPDMADLKRVIAQSDAEMTKYYPESPLSNWYADLLLLCSESICGSRCDISVGNFGGIRVDMPKGDVIVDDIRSMFPFKNDIVIVKHKGSTVRKIFTDMARKNFQVLGGVRIVANRNGLESVLIGGKPLDDNKVYTMITNTFLLHGGDGLFLADDAIEINDTKLDMYETVMAGIETLVAQGKHIYGECDGRIVINDARAKAAADASEKAVPTERPEDKLIAAGVKYTVGAETAPHSLNILHTNDTHSHIDPVRAGESAGYAGVVERAVFVDSVRVADGAQNVLLVDAGDFEQGTPYFTLFRGKVEIESMNAMGYDAATLGNHEFDNGLDDLANRIQWAHFPIVLCNYDFGTHKLAERVKPYVIIERGGKKIGITGVLTDVSAVVDAEYAAQLNYLNPVEPVNRIATYLKDEQGCDIVVVLSHLGFIGERGGDVGDLELASKVSNVDYIIGGHSHTNLTAPAIVKGADGNDVAVVTDYCWGIYVGQLKIN